MPEVSKDLVPPEVSMDWTPLYDKIIVRRLPELTEVKGFAIPDAHKKAQNAGVVVRVGSGRWIDGVLYPLTVSPGNIVLFTTFAGLPIEGNEEFLVLREDELLAWKEATEEPK